MTRHVIELDCRGCWGGAVTYIEAPKLVPLRPDQGIYPDLKGAKCSRCGYSVGLFVRRIHECH